MKRNDEKSNDDSFCQRVFDVSALPKSVSRNLPNRFCILIEVDQVGGPNN
jgi:hypothetical protein